MDGEPIDNGVPSDLASTREEVAKLTELVGGLAHELRNPLSTMMVNLQLLAEDLRDERADLHDTRRRALVKVDVLLGEAQRLQTLFDQFLTLTAPFSPHPALVDLGEVVRSLAAFIEPQAQAEGIRVVVRTPEGGVRCLADENLLRQGLMNIIRNAQQAMPEGGTLTLSVGTAGEEAFVSVSDTGVGIEPGDRERILRPFFSTKSSGTGLGLSITQRIVRAHGGRLELESTPGKGTTFTVFLPLKGPAVG
ncbi:MAG: sensor histidine kinase [Planctomycetota bacterium]|nr:MAG: sensor histidine kinase [Planctomycetota bacterium]